MKHNDNEDTVEESKNILVKRVTQTYASNLNFYENSKNVIPGFVTYLKFGDPSRLCMNHIVN